MLRKRKNKTGEEFVDPTLLSTPQEPENQITPDQPDAEDVAEEEVVAEDVVLTEEEVAPDAESSTGNDNPGKKDESELLTAFEAWLQDSMPESGDHEAALANMSAVRDCIIEGDYDDALFDVIAKGTDYCRAVETAAMEGETRGRNARIDELLAAETDDDGLPHPGCGGDPSARTPSIFDLAREA